MGLLAEGIEHYKQIDAYNREDTIAREWGIRLCRMNGLVDSDVEHGKGLAERSNGERPLRLALERVPVLVTPTGVGR